ncbi:MAG: cell division protein ZapA [Oscillospiraceae bacterium]|nr:cell division protein ZapA [Oscillospiraceae bacterium]
MGNVNKIKIEIAGASYTVATSEQEGYVRDLAKEMSEDIEGLMTRNPALSMNDALVLCSIAYLSEYKKEAANSDHIRSQLKEYLGDTARARMEVDEANRRADKLAKEVEELRRRYGV